MLSLGKLLKNRIGSSLAPAQGKEEVSIKFAILEVIIFVIIIYSIGFILNREDPLFINNKFSIAIHMLPLTVLTLFYGFLTGAAYLISFAIVKYIIYGAVDMLFLMYLFLYLLILAEFHFYWTRKIRHSIEKMDYIEDKLRDLGRSLYLTKLSHDRLESYHIVKPISIRGFLEDIKKDILSNLSLEDTFKKMVQFLANIYMIEKCGLYKIESKGFVSVIKLGNMEELNHRDALVLYAMEKGETTYISGLLPEVKSNYLCAIPIHSDKDLRYLFVIERMPFFNLNVDNLLSINVLLDYVTFTYLELNGIKEIRTKFGWVDTEILKEILRCIHLKNKFNIESSLIVFVLSEWDESVYHLISDTVRGLDMVSKVEDKSIIVLLPLTNLMGAYNFLKRFEVILRNFKARSYEELGITHRTFEVKDLDSLMDTVRNFIIDSSYALAKAGTETHKAE